MKFPQKDYYLTGTAVPVSSLKSLNSAGIGEFSDLKLLADWCNASSLDLIQLLPVNDTGYQTSPYSALSAYALHPAYIAIDEICPGYENETEAIRKKYNSHERLDFQGVLNEKLKLLKKIFSDKKESILQDKKITEWEKANPWLINYSVFSFLKEQNDNLVWMEWKKYRDPSEKEIKNLYKKHRQEMIFYSWIQYHLEKQLHGASEYLQEKGIALKGDLPILMNPDSADVWGDRKYFSMELRAGAPPDMFSEDGQYWDFPTYRWYNLEKDDYCWWKNRLKQASKFYHAYRIDHVLGFFRIWSIPAWCKSGSMGYYRPRKFITLTDLEFLGFDEGRIKWLTYPHVPGWELRESTGKYAEIVAETFLSRIGNEDLFLFKDEVTKDDIWAADLPGEIKGAIVNFFHNRTLLPLENETYAQTWYFRETRAYQSLSDHERHQFENLLEEISTNSAYLWENQGLKLLSFMMESSDMLVCAEDLGAIPKCVPKVLDELKILGLHVLRWSRHYHREGDPYKRPDEYSPWSVCTPAVHDSSTVRQWWIEESDKTQLFEALDIEESLSGEPDAETLKTFYTALLKTTSRLCIFQIQDLFALDDSLKDPVPENERINVPGTVNDFNWSYRVPHTLESLLENKGFHKTLNSLIKSRRETKCTEFR